MIAQPATIRSLFAGCRLCPSLRHTAHPLLADELVYALEIDLPPLPRIVGVTNPRHRWLGRAAQDQNAMIAGEVDPRLGYQGRQPCDEIYRVEGHLRRSVALGRLQVVDHLGGRT